MAAAPLPQPPAGAQPPQPGGVPPQGGQPAPGGGAGAQGAGDVKAAIEAFRQVAMQVQMLSTKFPESSDIMQQILPLLQKAMVQVAGNPARQQDPQAPPVGA